MKKVKNYLLVASFTYMIIILFLVISLFVFKRPYVNLEIPERVTKDFASLKKDIKNLEDGECKEELSKILNEYSNNTYDGKVKMRDLYGYISTEKIMNDYENMKSKCNFTNSQISKYGIANKYMVKMALQDEIIDTYLYQYELGFTDELSISYKQGIAAFAYRILKYNEVELIQDYIRMIEEN